MKSRTLILSAAVIVVALAWAVYLFANPADKPTRTYTGLPEVSAEASSSADASVTAEATGAAGLLTLRDKAAAQGGSGKTDSSAETASNDDDSYSDDAADSGDSDSNGSGTGVVPVPTGLSLAERQACYYDLIAAEDRAVAEAEATYPLDDENSDVAAHVELRMRLLDQYKSELLDKYDVTADQLEAIAQEGVSSGWPMPPLEE